MLILCIGSDKHVGFDTGFDNSIYKFGWQEGAKWSVMVCKSKVWYF